MKLITPPSLLILCILLIQTCFQARYLLIKLNNDKVSKGYGDGNKAKLNEEKVWFRIHRIVVMIPKYKNNWQKMIFQLLKKVNDF